MVPTMPKIGMRIVKSAIAAFLCLALFTLFGKGSPFYSVIAAILCMQPDATNSLKVAWNRTVGTLVGGLYGLVMLLLVRGLLPPDWVMLEYLVISGALIPLMYLTVLIKKPGATYITCVVFLSITISHSTDVSPYLFALNRILETLIGILVSLCVNNFRIPRKKNRGLLFLCGLDEALLRSDNSLSSYTKVKLNHLIHQGAQIAIATSRTPATVTRIFQDVPLRLPVVVMNGAALYDLQEKKYLDFTYIDHLAKQEVQDLFAQHSVNCFTYTAFDDVLHIYHGTLKNPAEQRFYQQRKMLPLKSFIHGCPSHHRKVLCFTLFTKQERADEIIRLLDSLDSRSKIRVFCHADHTDPTYRFIEIYSCQADKSTAIEKLQYYSGCTMVAAFGSNANDTGMMRSATLSYAVGNAQVSVKQHAGFLIGDHDSDSVVKMIHKLFYTRRLPQPPQTNIVRDLQKRE